MDKDEIGEGGFAVIFTARLSSSDSAKIVVKKLLASEKEAKKALWLKKRGSLINSGTQMLSNLKVFVLTSMLCCWSTFILILPHSVSK